MESHTVPEESSRPSAASEATLDVRLGYTVRVVGAALVFFSVLFVVIGRPMAAVIDATIAAALIAIVTWARRRGPASFQVACHLSFFIALVGLALASLIGGQADARVPWFMVCIPMAAAYLLSVRAAIGWGVAVAVVQVAVALSDRVWRFEPEWVPDRVENVLDEIAVTALVLVLAIVWRQLADAYKNEVRVKEEAILRQAEALREARDQALAAVRVRGEFLANVSHEIRTPLNGVIGMANLLLETATLTGSERDLVRTIDRSGKLLLALVNDILDFSKLESGGLAMDARSFSVGESVDGIVGLFVSSLAARPIELSSDVDPSVPRWVRADRRRFEQVLLNLVGNAVKFTEKGRITVRAFWDAPDRLRIEVADTGIGIPPDKLDRLFKPFSQVDASTTRRYGGTGLGLAISNRLVDLMDGRIWVDSEAGKGSTFRFTVTAPASDEPPPVESGDFLDGDLAKRRPLRILVAEDNPINREVADTSLRFLGYEPRVVDNGRAAVDAFARGRFDVVLMDLHMPEMDGLDATRRIRADLPPERQPWIVGLTASVLSEERERMRAAGFDAFVPKPFTLRDLAMALQGCPRPVVDMTDEEQIVEHSGTGSPGHVPPTASSRSSENAAPVPAGASDSRVLDPLEKLRLLCLRKPGSFEKLVRHYLQESASLHERIVKAMGDGSTRDLELASHSLKSSSAMLGCMQVSALCSSLEDYATDGDVESIRARLPELSTLLDDDRERLEAAIEHAI